MSGTGDDEAGLMAPLGIAVAELARGGPAVSAEDLAWEGPGRHVAPGGADVPVLRVEGFEGPLDWLPEQARAGRVDLARLPVLALVEQCTAAIEAVLAERRDKESKGGGAGPEAPAPLQRLAEWVVMAAWLAWLRSRLLLPDDDPEARAARDEAEALRRRLADRARVRDAVAWLNARPQLGRDVFARGGAAVAPAKAGRAADLPALLCTYARLMGPSPEQAREKVYRPRPHPLWRVPDALARMQALLPELLDTAAAAALDGDGGAASLWRFLPDTDALNAAALVRRPVPDPALLDRSAVASTFAAALELARRGRLALAQGEAAGEVEVRVAGTPADLRPSRVG